MLDPASLLAVAFGFVEDVTSSDPTKPKIFVPGSSGTSWAQLLGNVGDVYRPPAKFPAKLASRQG